MKSIQLINVADWHATKACDAYAKGDLDIYTKHIAIHDRLLVLAEMSLNKFAA